MRQKWTFLAMAAALSVPIVAHSQETKTRQIISPEPAKQEIIKRPKRAPLQGKQRDEALGALLAKQGESKELIAKATDLTISIGKLAASGKLPQDQEAMKLMKDMVETLQEIQDRLKKIDDEIDEIKGWIEGQKESLPVLTSDVAELKKTKITGYLQFQYRDTDQIGGQVDSFRMRRTEIGIAHQIDSRTSIKVSFDLSTSNFGTVNMPTDTSTTLKDAALIYDIEPSDVTVGTQLMAGQVKMPLGYELERSSSDREFPEYALYNQLQFAGERGRGLNLTKGLSTNTLAQIGLWNSLTYNDPEQRGFQGSQANRLGMSGSLRWFGKNFDVGVSGFFTERPSVQAGYTGGTQTKVFAPKIDRQFIYLDGQYVGLFLPGMFVRGELMFGKDRLPLSPNSTSSGSSNSGISNPDDVRLGQKDMLGWHTVLGYNFNSRNTLSFKYEQFDPDTKRSDNLMQGYGAAYTYYFNPNAKVTLSHEIFQDNSRLAVGTPAQQQTRYGVTTLRMQFKF